MASNLLLRRNKSSSDGSRRATPSTESPQSPASTATSTSESSVAQASSVTSAPSISPSAYDGKNKDPNTSYHLTSDDTGTPSTLGAGTTSDQLIQLTCDYISALNNRDWLTAESLQVSFHPSYITECRFTSREQTFLDSLSSIRDLARGFPDFKCKLIEASGKVEDDGKSAVCFFHTEWLDCPPEITTVAMYAIEWRFVDGMWLCWRTNVLRGVDEVV